MAGQSRNVTCTADVEEQDEMSKRLALEMEEEGAGRALFTTESRWRRSSKKEKILVHAMRPSKL